MYTTPCVLPETLAVHAAPTIALCNLISESFLPWSLVVPGAFEAYQYEDDPEFI